MGEPTVSADGGRPVQLGEPTVSADGGRSVQLGEPTVSADGGRPVQLGETTVSVDEMGGGRPVKLDEPTGVRYPQHTQTSSNSSTIAAGSNNGVTNTRSCRYSCLRS